MPNVRVPATLICALRRAAPPRVAVTAGVYQPQDRVSEFCAGRVCLGLALLESGAPSGHVCTRQPDGRPRLPNGFSGSISHSRGVAVAVASPLSAAVHLGVDIELHLLDPRAERMLPPVPLELAPEHDYLRATLKLAAVEAGFKAVAQHGDIWTDIDFGPSLLADAVLASRADKVAIVSVFGGPDGCGAFAIGGRSGGEVEGNVRS